MKKQDIRDRLEGLQSLIDYEDRAERAAILAKDPNYAEYHAGRRDGLRLAYRYIFNEEPDLA